MILSRFASKTKCFMKRISKYDRLCELIDESDGSVGFEDLSKKAGLNITRADNYIYKLYGMSGNELLSNLFNDGILPSC